MDADQLDQGADDKDKQDHHDRIRDQKPVFRKCGVSENMTPEERTYIAVIVDEVNAEGCCGDQIDRRNVRHFDLGKSQKHCDRDQHDRNLMHLIEEGAFMPKNGSLSPRKSKTTAEPKVSRIRKPDTSR